VPYDCGFVIVRDAKAHRLPLRVTASYLPDANDRRDPSHYVPELSRRARGFCTWAIFKALGRSGIVAMVEGHVALARHLAETIRGKPGLQVVNDVVLNQVLVACDTDDATVALEAKLRQENRYLLAGGRFNGRQVLRVSIIGLATTREHVDGLADDLIRVAGEIAGAR
jgi:glutamate/tyrosine decarboxylase-like PLP-dependent enzyme